MTLAESPALHPSAALHRTLGLTDHELEQVVTRLGRQPNDLELAMFSVMWSEHCSYKSSRALLRTLPTAGAGVVAGLGENAGVVSIGDGMAVAFKLESHNHPSAVEPYQGAATGVGGILRDIFTMGARPIALLDALKFGPPASVRTRHLVRGVVAGIGGYGNCVGVPTVGGELAFHDSFARNPLVNVMAVGILDERRLTRSVAPGPGNAVILFGSTTGRDGIGGASVLASATFGPEQGSKRPSVQIGDPFAEKLLIEACLEVIEAGLVEGLSDLGAAGLTCAASEMADRAGTGMLIELDDVPRREEGMAPFEVMISESQERMLAVVRPAAVPAMLGICARWGLPAAVVGRVTDDGDVTVRSAGVAIARIPARALTSDAIEYQREARPPSHRPRAPSRGLLELTHDGFPERGMDPGAVLIELMGDANVASRAWITGRYDETVGSDTVTGGAHGAAVMRIKGTTKGLVMATDSSPYVGLIDPYLGAVTAVAECVRNVAVTGARPLGVTDCLNFADPGRPEAFWQLAEAVRGLGDACRALGLSVTGGNVSLYNESVDGPIAPTTQVGVVGSIDDIAMLVGPAFTQAGDVVALLGRTVPGMGGSIYAQHAGQAPDDEPPLVDLQHELALGRMLALGAARTILHSAHDVSTGGLATCLAECAIWGGLGASVRLSVRSAPAVELFGEGPGRVVVSTARSLWPRLQGLAAESGVPVTLIGQVGGERLHIRLARAGSIGPSEDQGASAADDVDLALADLRGAWQRGLPQALGLDP
ncbi:phosphoribosylformylglycinamidine synthase subunit PurL [soil metagenome]